ncbi:MAG: LPS-assembly protein LptD [Sulfuricurvum sp.]|uniref:LPS-assembly protein LptD n=1 Tax=Sulfuricurvum sp. TaxID=2025608 RepID=UPI0025E40019|nr:LPS-assembly protein LptD [Sulfuricurvum sp.]MBV5321101.1 LPS-assembly protein LptD [Sulfuricurvum sp.]
MGKYIWISLITSTLLLGEDRVELYGTNVDAEGSIATATGNPVALYQDQIISADKLSYDRNASVMEANGSVNIFKAGHYHTISNYSRINLNDDTRYSTPYYAVDTQSGLWMSTSEAQGCQSDIDLASGSLSGCDSVDPLWRIRFSSADYNTDKMWVNLYNARLEIEDIPVFYLPYFGYPTDRTRRSGLLIPSLGWSGSEGFYYLQPVYLAPKNWWDLELRPQIRTLRGSGIYADFRFVDTLSSQGSIRMGYFKEQSTYALENDLAHIKHYGYDVHYRHSAPLREWFDLDLEGESGLYVDGKWMNDVDYLNLQESDETKNVTANQVMSRINLYYSSEDNYFGSYFKHYQYLNIENNGATIQTLPTFHYHRYLKSFLDDYLLISGDAMATHYYRPNGKRAIEANFNIPLALQTSVFDDYLDVSYTANASASMMGFYANGRPDETGSAYEQGKYAQLDHTFSIGSTLVKPYDNNITHVINPNVSYTSAGSRYYGGYYKTFHSSQECVVGNTDPACEYYSLNEPSDTLSLGVNNYVFENGTQLFVDRLSQNFRYDDQGSYYGELQNELEWQISSAISFYNQTAFNHDRNRVTKEQNTLRYNGEIVTAGVSHYYSDQLQKNLPVYASYWTADVGYRYNRNYQIFANVAYDYHESLMKRSEIGVLYTQRCFDFGVRFVQNRRPVLTNDMNNNSVNDSYIFITILLKPIGGSEFNYKLTGN